MKQDVARVGTLDSTLALLREGYAFIPNRCGQFHTNLFQARIFGERVYCMTGVKAAELFYDVDVFRRRGALPSFVLKTLFGRGAVHALDDEQHRVRKTMFISMMSKPNIASFLEIAEEQWSFASRRWESAERAALHSEAERVLCRAACLWAGVWMSERETAALSRDCDAMLNGFSSMGPRMWHGRVARLRAEHWGRRIIERVRRRELRPSSDAPASVIANHRDADGRLLPVRVAAVELLNIVRPITALARWVSFMGLALHDHPSYRYLLRGSETFYDAFVHEVRRFYPFVPFLAARVRRSFDWEGASFREGQLVLFDVYGTLRDTRVWNHPNEFRPERFLDRMPTAFDLVPQGGGDFVEGHRCAGEWLSIEALKQALRVLVSLRYEVPAQDLSFDLSDILSIPKSGFVMTNVKRQDAPAPMIDANRLRGVDAASASALRA